MTLEDMIHPTAQVDGTAILKDVIVGQNTKIRHYANLYECKIGDECNIGTYVEVQKDVIIGNRVTVSSHSFICSLVEIDDDAWLGHHVVTINDINPPSKKRTGTTDEWKPTYIGKGAVIGSNATLFPVNIGKYATIGAGAVVTKDVPDYAVVVGNPARIIKYNSPDTNEKI